MTARQYYIILRALCQCQKVFVISNVHTNTHLQPDTSVSGLPIIFREYVVLLEIRMGSASHGLQMQCLLRSPGKFTEQLPATVITASTINRQYYKMSVLHFPQNFRTTVARKYNLCCGHGTFCGLAAFQGLNPRVTFIIIRRNMSDTVQTALALVAMSFFRRVLKIAKSSYYFVMFVCLPVCPYGTTWLPLGGFS